MSETVIKAENISKQYQLGKIGYGTLKHDLQSWWARIRGKEDPNAVIGNSKHKDLNEDFWALKDISFEIKQGESVGIIGKNGAGKSTLMKILSRTTAPSTGSIFVKGKIASLLEVGTGFHPDLTGRENVYLNGSILGMKKREINKKFDEIVDFSGIEKFIDTPVKRYSSGMYVRLAFAVAAHLDSDILILDEVLSVGDMEFQKKCLGKMDDVASKQGRTVLFVSHSMPAITRICQKCILLESGKLVKFDMTSNVILNYYSKSKFSGANITFSDYVGDEYVRLLSASIINMKDEVVSEVDIEETFKIIMKYEILQNSDINSYPNFHLYNSDNICVFVTGSQEKRVLTKGIYSAECILPGNFLNEGVYFVGVAVTSFTAGIKVHFFKQNIISFNIRDMIENVSTRKSGYTGSVPGVVRPILTWGTSEDRLKLIIGP